MKQKSIIINGQTTSLKLEVSMWEELEFQALEMQMNWRDYIRFVLADCPAESNRASFIRSSLIRRLREWVGCNTGRNIIKSSWTVECKGQYKRYDFTEGRIFAGRDNNNHLRLTDHTVSKYHLMLAFDRRNWWAIDLNSKNGTRDHKLKPVTRALVNSGQPFYMGNSKLIYLP